MFELGLLNWSGWEVLFYTLLMTHISIVTVTVYLHRAMAHRALNLHPIVAHFFRFWSWFTTATVTKEWVSIHRKHHAKCETDEDPHSPVRKGLGTVLLKGAELYEQAKQGDTLDRYGKGCPDDWVEQHVYSKYPKLGIFILLALNLVLFGPIGLTVWAIQMLWMPVHAAGIINGLGHHFGYRNFECADAATNITPIAIWIGGEELHNNHHTYPNSAKLSQRRWEFDIGWMYIRLLMFFGLATDVRTGPKAHIQPQKAGLDTDTALALANNRFKVMAAFNKQVIGPVIKQTKANASEDEKSLYRRAKKLLSRDNKWLKSKHIEQKESLLTRCEVSKTLYTLKQQLMDVWSHRTKGSESLLKALEDWCKEAEAVGHAAVEDFITTIKQYSTQPAN